MATLLAGNLADILKAKARSTRPQSVEEATSMLTLAGYFWPVIWATIGVGALVTAALSVALATASRPRQHVYRIAAVRPRHGFRVARHAHA
jgi:hypothetical protein